MLRLTRRSGGHGADLDPLEMEKPLVPTENRRTIPRLSNPQPGRYTDCSIRVIEVHMQQKLPGIISLDFDVTVQIPSRYSAFVSYRRTKGTAVGQYMISQSSTLKHTVL